MGFTRLEDYQCNDSVSSCSSEVSSVGSVESDLENSMEEVTSSLSSSPDFPFSYSSSPPSGQHAAGDSLNDMSSLLQQLPFKRGLSKHFQGKSQSFTCLSNVTCLEDLAKPENPYNKKLKSCKSYMGFSENPRSSSDHHLRRSASSRLISKKASRGSCSSFINSKRNNNNGSSFNGNKPPIHPLHRSDNDSTISFSNQTPLFV